MKKGKVFFLTLFVFVLPFSQVRSINMQENYRNYVLSWYSNEISQSIASNNKVSIYKLMPDIPCKATLIPVLLYHCVGDVSNGSYELYVSTAEFEKQIKYLVDNHYTPIHFSEADAVSSAMKPVIITFDDGYRNNYTNAYPILKKYNVKATIFLVSSFIGRDPYLYAAEITGMIGLIDFQSHSSTHRELTSLSAEELEKEAAESRDKISAITGKPVYAVSYPYGNYNDTVIDIMKKYYKYGLTIEKGIFLPSVPNNFLCIGRIYVFRSTDMTNFINHLEPAVPSVQITCN